MEFHGIKEKTDMWINYFPQECCEMDVRVVEFFQDVHTRGMKKYNQTLSKQYERDHKKEKEEQEKAEFERLNKKYGKGSPNA